MSGAVDSPPSDALRAWLAPWVRPQEPVAPEAVLDAFLQHFEAQGTELYDAQQEALLTLCSGQHVVLATPTGSGKSLVALFHHALSASQQRRSVYTSPIKALVHEKFFALCRDFGAEHVGMMTGDASVNRDAPILCATAEVLAQWSLSPDGQAQVHDVVMDEFHYYGDAARGSAWQIPLLTLPKAQFLLMSATLGDPKPVMDAIAARTRREVALVHSRTRPVPLDYRYSEVPLQEAVQTLCQQGDCPLYVVHFSQAEAVQNAQALTSIDVCSKEQKAAIAAFLGPFAFDSPFGKVMRRLLTHGIGLHHAGLLPKYRLLVETMAQKGLLKVLFGTDTLGVGINVPIRCVVFSTLCKYDGEKVGLLKTREFHQIAGRAGRKGFDTQGSVLCQAPEHVIENRRMESRVAGDAKKLRKLVRKKPPKNFVAYDANTFLRLQQNEPESVRSQFALRYDMLCTLLRVQDNGYRALVQLIGWCHDSPKQKQHHRRQAKRMAQVLMRAGLVRAERLGAHRRLVLAEGVGSDFGLTHALTLFALEAFSLLDPLSPTYALDVLSVVESILESPGAIVARLVRAARDEAYKRMQAEGLDYEQRQAELERVEMEKPLAEQLYPLFDAWQAQNPWAADAVIRPKSIARRLVESAAGFAAFVRSLGLERVEGVLWRYLADAARAMQTSLPSEVQTPEVIELTAYLRALVRQVDTSLVQAWEGLTQNESAAAVAAPAFGPGAPQTVGEAFEREPVALLARLRGEVHLIAMALAHGDAAGAAAAMASEPHSERTDSEQRAQREEALGALVLQWQQRPIALCRTPMAKQPRLTQCRREQDTLHIAHELLSEGGEPVATLRLDVPCDTPMGQTGPWLLWVGADDWLA